MVDTFHNMASLLRLDCSHCSHKDSARLDSMLCSLCSASHSQDGTKSDIKLAKLRPFIRCLGARTRRTHMQTKPKQETKARGRSSNEEKGRMRERERERNKERAHHRSVACFAWAQLEAFLLPLLLLPLLLLLLLLSLPLI